MLVFYLCHILNSPLSLPFWPHIWKSSGSLDAPFFGAGGKFPAHMRILTLGLYSNSNKNPKPVLRLLYQLSQSILDLLERPALPCPPQRPQ